MRKGITSNTHTTVERLRTVLAHELAVLEKRIRQPLCLEPLGSGKAVADATTKAIVRTSRGAPIAVIICSSPVAPDNVARSTRRADAVRSLLNEPTSSAIIQPIHEGVVDRLSYVMLPWFQPLTSSRIQWIWQRRVLRRPILTWLRKATAESARQLPAETVHFSYVQALRYFKKQPFVNGDIRSSIDTFLARLRDNSWSPCYTFDHNDFWHGNILLRPQMSAQHHMNGTSSSHPFVLIDWGAANPNGFGMYDLLRICRSLKVPPMTLRKEIAHHCRLLGSAVDDAPGHLLAGLGSLHCHREYFQQRRFVDVFHTCWRQLQRARMLETLPIA